MEAFTLTNVQTGIGLTCFMGLIVALPDYIQWYLFVVVFSSTLILILGYIFFNYLQEYLPIIQRKIIDSWESSNRLSYLITYMVCNFLALTLPFYILIALCFISTILSSSAEKRDSSYVFYAWMIIIFLKFALAPVSYLEFTPLVLSLCLIIASIFSDCVTPFITHLCGTLKYSELPAYEITAPLLSMFLSHIVMVMPCMFQEAVLVCLVCLASIFMLEKASNMHFAEIEPDTDVYIIYSLYLSVVLSLPYWYQELLVISLHSAIILMGSRQFYAKMGRGSDNTKSRGNKLSCAVCGEEYSTYKSIPFVLPCGHTFCLPCTGKLKPQKCPYCKLEFFSFQIRKNYALCDALERMKTF